MLDRAQRLDILISSVTLGQDHGLGACRSILWQTTLFKVKNFRTLQSLDDFLVIGIDLVLALLLTLLLLLLLVLLLLCPLCLLRRGLGWTPLSSPNARWP